MIAQALRGYASTNSTGQEDPYSEIAAEIESWQVVVEVSRLRLAAAVDALKKGVKGA